MKIDYSREELSIKGHLFYCTIIALIIMIFAAVSLKAGIIKDTLEVMETALADNVITIAVSILCSVLASVIYASVMKKEGEKEKAVFKDHIKESIEEVIRRSYDEKIDDGISRITQSVTNVYNDTSDMMPSRWYRSADQPDYEFNLYLDQQILKSSKFIHFGESARFTCKRLYKLKDSAQNTKNLEVEIFMVDPTQDKVFEANKHFLNVKEKNRNPGSSRSIEEIIEEEKLKILSCLYALNMMAGYFLDIKLYLVKDLPFIEIEMTDRMIALEFFRTYSEYKRYPLTIIYEEKKTYYEGYKFYFDWEKKKAEEIDANTMTMDKILEIGRKSGFANITEDEIKGYCAKEIFNG